MCIIIYTILASPDNASSAPANGWVGVTTHPHIRHRTYVIMQYKHYKNNYFCNNQSADLSYINQNTLNVLYGQTNFNQNQKDVNYQKENLYRKVQFQKKSVKTYLIKRMGSWVLLQFLLQSLWQVEFQNELKNTWIIHIAPL